MSEYGIVQIHTDEGLTDFGELSSVFARRGPCHRRRGRGAAPVVAAVAAVEATGIRTCLSAPYLWDDITVMRHLGSLESEALFARLVAANARERLAPETILEMLCINAARSAGLDTITGSLEVGKRADLVVKDPNAVEAFPGFFGVPGGLTKST